MLFAKMLRTQQQLIETLLLLNTVISWNKMSLCMLLSHNGNVDAGKLNGIVCIVFVSLMSNGINRRE